jgi:hypothetical protein
VRLKELGIPVEREWWVDEEGTAYLVDLALPTGAGWLPVSFGDRLGPVTGSDPQELEGARRFLFQ